ncbi:hypothetical protein BDP81DRAFT_454175 [Colletotrichum phormii]|uniref:Uncharacterized protein n=1 Tax=Colletotrichum phormii TaxID=359342 RepID=A0AAI9ZI42_9PEZI|nr:uncharacterized protein BDP81DRAFT_454175 [Colletotrichum phormii]KAK1623724.1 hypothetical protein BDP81DRAFT_454175 [Colletotrichum phormii]
MWDASSGESRGGAGAGPTAITGLQLEGRVGPGTDALSRSRSGTSNGSGGAGGAAINGHGQGGSGGAGAVGAGVGGAIGRRTSSLKTTGSPQKKLTPPPQLGERNLLRSGSVSVSASLSSVTGSVTREREGHLGGAHPYHRQSSTSTSQQPQPQHQHHTSTSTSSSTTTQQIRVHLRRGGSAGPHQPQQYQPVQPYQYQVPGRERGPPPAPTSGAASRSRDTIANYNRLCRETQHSSTSTLHHQNYWPDNFRNPRGGLGIEHSNNATRSNSIATNPRNDNQPRTGGIQKLALEESGVAEE